LSKNLFFPHIASIVRKNGIFFHQSILSRLSHGYRQNRLQPIAHACRSQQVNGRAIAASRTETIPVTLLSKARRWTIRDCSSVGHSCLRVPLVPLRSVPRPGGDVRSGLKSARGLTTTFSSSTFLRLASFHLAHPIRTEARRADVLMCRFTVARPPERRRPRRRSLFFVTTTVPRVIGFPARRYTDHRSITLCSFATEVSIVIQRGSRARSLSFIRSFIRSAAHTLAR
jgi:hypothetical protein